MVVPKDRREKEELRLVKEHEGMACLEVPKILGQFCKFVCGILPSSIRVRKPKPMHKVLQPLARALALFKVIHRPLKLSLDALRQRWRLVDTRSPVRADNRYIENWMHMLSMSR
jgi:hypothetical protein